MSLTIQFLPAREGDAIWLRWTDNAAAQEGTPDGTLRQAIIDMGKEQTGRELADRLRALPEDQRAFDLLVITHMDGDHIGGVLTCLSDVDEPIPGLEFKDVWFNGWPHLHGERAVFPGQPAPEAGEPPDPAPEPEPQSLDTGPSAEPLGPVQGERFTKWLVHEPWNEAFGGGPVVRPDNGVTRVELPGGVRLTVLGPTQDRLTALIDTWRDDVARALARGTLDWASTELLPLPGAEPTVAGDAGAEPATDEDEEFEPGFEPLGPRTPPVLESVEDLRALADTEVDGDSSGANGASIVLLLEWGGRRVLLTGDAFADDVVAGLAALRAADRGETSAEQPGEEEDEPPVALDLLKLPHHGSARNVSAGLVEAVETPLWVNSSDGTRFRHPDAIALARVLVHGRREEPVLAFNVPSTYNLWWDNDSWRALIPYSVEYGDPNEGLTVTFSPGA